MATPIISSAEAESSTAPSAASNIESGLTKIGDLSSPSSFIQRLGDNVIYTASPWFSSQGVSRRRPKSTFDVSVRAAVESNDNLFLDAKNPESEFIGSLAPKFTLNLGDYQTEQKSFLSASYSPAAVHYFGGKADDSLDHLFDLSGAYRLTKLAFPVTFEAKRQTSAFVEAGARETVMELGGTLGATYDWTGKSSFGLIGNYRRSDYETFSDFYTHGAEAYFNHRIGDKTSAALVFQTGAAKSDGSPKQDFHNALVRVKSKPSGKLSFAGEAGLSRRKLDSGDRDDFIYRVGAVYQPTAKSRVALETYRLVTNSAFTVGAGYVATGLRAAYTQEIGERLSLDLAAGYEQAAYFSAVDGLAADRDDEYAFLSSALRYQFSQDWAADVFYTYGDNGSSDDTLSFSNHRVGLGLTWTH